MARLSRSSRLLVVLRMTISRTQYGNQRPLGHWDSNNMYCNLCFLYYGTGSLLRKWLIYNQVKTPKPGQKLEGQVVVNIVPSRLFFRSFVCFQPTNIHCWTKASFNDFHPTWSCATYIQRLPATLFMPSDHLVGGICQHCAAGSPFIHFGSPTSVLRAKCPTHFHFSITIRWAMSVTLVRLRMSSFLIW